MSTWERLLEGVSASEVEPLQSQIQSAIDRLATLNENMDLIKALKSAMDAGEEVGDMKKGR